MTINKIRILNISSALDYGGVEKLLKDWYDKSNKDEIEFEYITLSNGGNTAKYLSEHGCSVYIFKPIREIGLKKYKKQYDDFFKIHNDYDIVHTHLSLASYYSLKVAKKYGIPNRFLHTHSNSFTFRFKYKLPRFLIIIIEAYLKLRCIYYATKLLACSENSGHYAYMNFNYTLINNGINCCDYSFDITKRENMRLKLGISDCFVLGHVGRLSHEKNQCFLLEIFKYVVKKRSDAVLILVGDGKDKSIIQNKCHSLGLDDSVILLGSRDDVNELMQAFDIFVLPSLFEGLGIVAIEAQA